MTTPLSPQGSASAHEPTPGTFVQVGAAPHMELQRTFSQRHPAPGELAPEVALVLAAVLLAAAEQVSEAKLAAFGVARREDLTLLALAMAFRDDDTGLVGDVFEWSLLLALNAGEPAIAQLVTDAMLLQGLTVEQPQAVLVAAEPGRIVTFSPQLPAQATLATGRRGRPPQVANLLRDADTSTWKADLLLGGAGERWVTASLKSNPRDLQRSLVAAADTPHPPRIGITSSRSAGLTRDGATGAVLVHVPVHGPAMTISKLVLADVVDAFSRHLSVPDTPLRQDATGIGRQLHRWQNQTVAYVTNVLLEHGAGREPLFRWYPLETGASEPDAQGALVAVNTLVGTDTWENEMDLPGFEDDVARLVFGQFDPVD